LPDVTTQKVGLHFIIFGYESQKLDCCSSN